MHVCTRVSHIAYTNKYARTLTMYSGAPYMSRSAIIFFAIRSTLDVAV